MGISTLDNAAVRAEIELPELKEGNPYLFEVQTLEKSDVLKVMEVLQLIESGAW